MTRNLNLDAVQAFAAFADRLNFTHAAEDLHISQPALHMKVQELSSSLGLPLYRKVGRRLELTEAGKRVARFGRELTQDSEALLHDLAGTAENQPLVLAAGEGAYLYLLGPAIREFTRAHDAPLRLVTLDREGVIDAIQSGKAHIGVASLSTPPPGFDCKLLRKVEQMLVMPSDHPLARKRKIRLSDLAEQQLVVPPADRPHRQALAAALQSAGVSWNVAVEAAGWELLLHFVKLGMGAAVVNSICTIPRGLVARPLPELPKQHYHVLHLRGAAKTGAQARLKELLLIDSRK